MPLHTKRGRAPRGARLGRWGQSVGLSRSWQTWIAQNLAAGASPEELARALSDRGVPRIVVSRFLSTLANGPGYAAARHHAARAERRTQVLQLLKTLSCAERIESTRTVTPEDFHARFVASCTPLVLTDITREWPAMSKWSLSFLDEELGDERIQICSGREADARPDENYEQHLEEVTVRDFVARLRATEGASNDVYLIANNNALRDTALRRLLDDVRAPAFMDPVIDERAASLWIGPAGTHTPLHHDTCNILFNQIVGRKRFRLLPPWDTRLLDDARGFYAADDVDPEAMNAQEVVLEPGMSLFLPAGWWHDVVALDTSISISLLRFQCDPAVGFYGPGLVSP